MDDDRCVQFISDDIESSHGCDAMSVTAISCDERWIAVGSPNELYDLERTGVVYLFRLSPINQSYDLVLVLNTLEESTEGMKSFGRNLRFEQDGQGHLLEVCGDSKKYHYSLQYTDVIKLENL
jgi:hypothetical protein